MMNTLASTALPLLKATVPPFVLLALIFAALRVKGIKVSSFLASLPRRGTVITVVVAAAILPAGWRLAVLPLHGIPAPKVHDEFTHLLTADTLAAGRLANPPHQLWQHLDTIYVLQHPTYAGHYTIGQGAILAVGKILTGNAWFGIVLSMALMGAAITWVLFELLPLGWAAVGALPIVFTYGLQWVDSYWGGSFCAFGGALLFGALLRLRKSPSAGMGFVAGVGWSIVWLIRPFESTLLFVLLWAIVASSAIQVRTAWREWIPTVAALAAILACAGGVTLLHNHAVTGTFATLPYNLGQQVDGVPQNFAWQPAIPPPRFRFPEMREMYEWQLQQKRLPAATRASSTAQATWEFFVTPWFSLPLLLSLFAIRDRMVAASWAILTCALAATLLYPFFFPHYIAAYSCIFAFLIVRGMMILDRWWIRGTPVGRWLALFVILGALLQSTLGMLPLKHLVKREAAFPVDPREHVIEELKGMGGTHVVFVRYGPRHSFHDEWVYNAANIDLSPIVWCRWMGPMKDSEVIRYYPGRQFWIVDVDGVEVAPKLSRYPGQ